MSPIHFMLANSEFSVFQPMIKTLYISLVYSTSLHLYSLSHYYLVYEALRFLLPYSCLCPLESVIIEQPYHILQCLQFTLNKRENHVYGFPSINTVS